jgi:hypothetical protein
MLDFMATTEPGPDDEIDLRTALIAAAD